MSENKAELLPFQKTVIALIDHVSQGGKIAIAPRCPGKPIHNYFDMSYWNNENHPTCIDCGYVDKTRELKVYGTAIKADSEAGLYEKIVGRKSEVLK